MKKHKKYKNSGIEWLGMIPEHWKIYRIKDITTKVGSGITPSGGANVYLDQGIMFFRSQNIHNNKLDFTDIAYISTEIDKKMANTRIRPQDVLLNITGASIGRSFYVQPGVIGNVNQHVCIIRPKQKFVSTKFLHYSIISNYGQNLIFICQNGANREGLNFQQINSFSFLLPSVTEQEIITNYLDSKTQLIDRKIELLNNKISYYKEFRKSLINKVVCRGLDDSVKRKDSGIDCIGKIPEHWNFYRLKDKFDIYTGNSISDKTLYENIINGLPYIATKDIDIDQGNINYDNGMFIPCTMLNNFKISHEKSSLICIEGASAGKKMGFNTRKSCFVNKLCSIKSKRDNTEDKYFYYQLQSNIWATQFFAILNGMIGGVSVNSLKSFHVILPPKEEQIEIVKYLDKQTNNIDCITNNLCLQIVKLQELRKTLINDVVTGKIKVTE